MAVGETYNFKLIFELNLNISAETISSSSKENILDIFYKSLVWWSWMLTNKSPADVVMMPLNVYAEENKFWEVKLCINV